MSDLTTGLRLEIIRPHRGSASNDGYSATCNEVTLVGLVRDRRHRTVTALTGDSRGPFEVSDIAPAVVLVFRVMGTKRIAYVEPLTMPDAGRIGWMAGGSYLTGDSRFSNLTDFYGAVAFHDRQE